MPNLTVLNSTDTLAQTLVFETQVLAEKEKVTLVFTFDPETNLLRALDDGTILIRDYPGPDGSPIVSAFYASWESISHSVDEIARQMRRDVNSIAQEEGFVGAVIKTKATEDQIALSLTIKATYLERIASGDLICVIFTKITGRSLCAALDHPEMLA